MEIKDIRQLRLKEWFADKKLPPKDASFISQVIGGKFIGEKAARRLERDHGIPHLFLDTPLENEAQDDSIPIHPGAGGIGKIEGMVKNLGDLLLTLPDDDAEKLLEEFLASTKQRAEYYEQKYAEWLKKNKLK